MSSSHQTSPSAALGRVFWMMVGPMIGTILLFVIVKEGNGWFTWADFAFLAVLAGLILGRWLEFQGGHAETGTGEPATPVHLRRYVLAVFVVGLPIWVAANLVANHWL